MPEGASVESLYEIPLFKVFMPPSVMRPLGETLFSGYVGEGPKVAEFEKALCPWVGGPNVLAVNSGTSALQLALSMCDLRANDEVISTPMTCVATNEPILHVGARVVWADTDPATGNVDPRDIERKITVRTRAIVVMHWGGNPCDLDAIHSIAAEYGLPVIEDACHAFGASYHEKPVGAHSEFTCFSFQAIKTLTTGDGGALVCRDVEAHERARKLRWYGLDRSMERRGYPDQDIVQAGYKYHMNDIAATIGLEQLQYVSMNLNRARANAAKYDEAFAGLREIRPVRRMENAQSSCWLYTVLSPNRGEFVDYLRWHGIQAGPVHARNDHYSIFKESATELPGVDQFDREHVCIPVGWWLGRRDVRRITDCVLAYEQMRSGARVAVSQSAARTEPAS